MGKLVPSFSLVKPWSKRADHGGVCNDQTNHSACDHGNKHEGGHVVPGLLQQPHGKHGGKEDINEGDIAPCALPKISGQFMPIAKEANDAHNADNCFLPAGQVKLFLDKAEHNREYHKHDGDHALPHRWWLRQQPAR